MGLLTLNFTEINEKVADYLRDRENSRNVKKISVWYGDNIQTNRSILSRRPKEKASDTSITFSIIYCAETTKDSSWRYCPKFTIIVNNNEFLFVENKSFKSSFETKNTYSLLTHENSLIRSLAKKTLTKADYIKEYDPSEYFSSLKELRKEFKKIDPNSKITAFRDRITFDNHIYEIQLFAKSSELNAGKKYLIHTHTKQQIIEDFLFAAKLRTRTKKFKGNHHSGQNYQQKNRLQIKLMKNRRIAFGIKHQNSKFYGDNDSPAKSEVELIQTNDLVENEKILEQFEEVSEKLRQFQSLWVNFAGNIQKEMQIVFSRPYIMIQYWNRRGRNGTYVKISNPESFKQILDQMILEKIYRLPIKEQKEKWEEFDRPSQVSSGN